jgi:glycosyltransferase involved in cell wall biosynthesis
VGEPQRRARGLDVTRPTRLNVRHGRRPLILRSGQAGDSQPDPVERPRTDFDVLADHLGGRVSYPGAAAAPVAAAEKRARLSVSQAVRAVRARAPVYVSLSERVGIPLALLGPPAPHVMVAHLLTSTQKRLVAERTGFLHRTDVTLVFSRAQERYLREDIGLGEQQAQFVWDKVDHRFFAPADPPAADGYVLSVGREQRDYEALIEALRPLRVPSVIVPGSSWSHQAQSPLSVPDHIEVRQGLSYPELRALYQGARVVAVPVQPGTGYAAGVNGVLEAMSCARPVVASDTPGLSGYVEDGRNGRQVVAGEPAELRTAIQELWEDRGAAERLARSGRATVERGRTVEHFVDRITGLIDTLV